MRVLMTLMLLLVSGSAWADALKVKVKGKTNSHEHRHDGHDNRAEWGWRRPSWSLFYSNKSPHYRHQRYTGNNRPHSNYSRSSGHDKQQRNWRTADQSHRHYSRSSGHDKQQRNWRTADQSHRHYSRNSGHDKQQRNWRTADQSHRHYSRNSGHDKQQRNWRTAEQFRTRRSNKSEPVIYINAEVSAISLRGIKWHAAIYDVYAELRNGRRIPLRNLEGSLRRGESFTRHFKDSHYVTKLFLHVGPEYRHQRAYVSVDYLPANSPERGHKQP
jgi:hypothetical protein